MLGRRYLFLIPLAALLAISPLIVWGNSCGHDFEFHLRSWLEVSSQWKQGVLLPRWDFTAAWNSGEPRFIFYPPLSWTVGAALGFLLPWTAVPTVFIWLALTASGFTMYRLAREWTNSNNAVIAACFYMVHPYMLFNAYERAAYGELLAAAWVPLLLFSVLRPRLSVSGIAVPICLLWLSNDPAAVIGCYSFALLALIRLAAVYRDGPNIQACFEQAARISVGVILGIGLAAFYICPAVIEQHWVEIRMPFVRGVRYQDNFAFGHLGQPSHDAILRTVSLCGISLVLLSVVFAAISLHVGKNDIEGKPSNMSRDNRHVLALALLICVVSFLVTSPSSFLWKYVPELKYLQFPWRFYTILGATAAALLALAIRRTGLHPVAAAVTALTLTLILTLGGNFLFRQPYFRELAPASIVHDFDYGGHYDPTDEYTPAGADPLALSHANPMFWIAARPTDPAPQTEAGYSVVLANRLHFNVSSPISAFVVLSLRDYRAWKITINGNSVSDRPHRADGLIALPIHSGLSRIDIAYTRSPDQIAGWIISTISAVLLFFFLWQYKRTASQQGLLRCRTKDESIRS